jgi:hypothetical protein
MSDEKIVVSLLDQQDSSAWDDFVNNSNNGTIFHKLKFQKYHAEGRFEFHNLVFKRNNKIVALLPGYIKDKAFISPAGASYGGPILKSCKFSAFEEVVDAFLQYCQDNQIEEIYITPPPLPYLKEEHQNLEFILEYKGFKKSKTLISNCSDLDFFNKFNSDDEIKSFINKKNSAALSKAYRFDCTIEINEDYENFYPLLLENKKKFDATPTHSLEELKNLAQLFPKEFKLFMAYNDKKEAVAGILVVACNSKSALIFYISQDYDYQEHRIVNRLLYEIILWSRKNNFHRLDIGVSVDTSHENPIEPSRNLIFFKERVANTHGFTRSTFHKKINE